MGLGVDSASTRNLSGGKVLPSRKADNLTAVCELTVSEFFGLPWFLRGKLYLRFSINAALFVMTVDSVAIFYVIFLTINYPVFSVFSIQSYMLSNDALRPKFNIMYH
jgi:hypothetical protein